MNNPFFCDERGYSLFLERVYVEYDGPLFFLCKDSFQANYLCSASIETDDFSSWTAVKVTIERLKAVLSDKVSLYDLFGKAETGNVYYIKSYHDRDVDVFEEVICANLDDSVLPAKNTFLELSDQELFCCELVGQQSDSELLNSATSSLTAHYDIEITSSKDHEQHFLRASTAGGILVNLEDMRLAMQPIKGKMPSRISDKRARNDGFNIYKVAAASFVLKLRAQRGSLVDGDVEDSLQDLINLLAFSKRSPEFDTFISLYSQSLINSYKKLTSLLISNDYEIGIKVAFPWNANVKELYLSGTDLMERKLLLDGLDEEIKETITLHGELTGFEPMKKEVFSFLPDEGEDYITGKIDKIYLEEIKNRIVPYQSPSSGTIGLIKITKYPGDEDKEKKAYIMSSFLLD